ncbi:MAG: FG-GAP repeat protein [Bacteroidota bacterium]
MTAPDNSGIGENIAIHNNFFITGNSADNGASDGLSILDDAGSAYIFELDENELWQIDSKIVASDRSIFASFGGSVDISDNYAVVSAVGETYDENGLNPVFGSGAVYIFKRIGTGMWNQVQKIVAQDRDEGDNFGISVAISNDVVAVGAWFEDGDMGGTNAISNSGSAYIFELNNNDEWLQTQKILPSERVRSGHFGFSLAMDENDLFAGAYFNRAAYFFSNLSLINNSPICSSEPITYTATFSESATNYHFFQDLNQNGEVDTGESLQNGTSNTFTTNSLSDGDVVSVLVTTSNGTNLFTSTASIISTPENDICANAQVLDLANNSTTSTTVCANASTLSSTCTPTTNTDAWYTFTPFASEESTITVFPTGDTPIDDPVIELYSGDCNNLTYIDCADDNGSGSGEFLMQNVETETDYFIRVSGAADGEFFILVDSRVLLPVELIDFSGKAIASGNLLTWHTA